MIYFFDSYDNFDAENFLNFLPEERVKKFQKLRPIRDKENCIFSYVILKNALKNEFGIDTFELQYSENGKPELINCKAHFNLSHSKSGIVVAVNDAPIGVDVQEIVPYNESVMKRVFTPNEINMVLKSSNKDRTFTRLWTLKESALKYDAKSLINLSDYEFDSEDKHFKKYGKNFSTFEIKNLIVTVCADKDFFEIKTVEAL
jgi:phosphopantetheine--protein transferase-like protein